MATDNPVYVKGIDKRQFVCGFNVDFTLADFVGRGNVLDLKGPPGSQLIGGAIVIKNNSDATGTDTIKVGDPVDDDRYLAATSIKQADGTRAAFSPTGYESINPVFVRLTRTPQDTTATGFTVNVSGWYTTRDKQDFTEG